MNNDTGFITLLQSNINKKWELVIFVSTVCNSSCSHCWSYNTYLGKIVDLEWYNSFFSLLNSKRISEIKLTGGETTLYPFLPQLISLIRKYIPSTIPIVIFTNGRKLVPIERSETSVIETVHNIKHLITNNKNISLQMSADEHHAGSLFRMLSGQKLPSVSIKDIRNDNSCGFPYLKNMVLNFLDAIKIINQESYDLEFKGRLKIHCEQNRLKMHREVFYKDLSDSDWNTYVIATEGLIDSGNAKNLQNTIKIEENNDRLSAFVFPGAEFVNDPSCKKSECYMDVKGKKHYFIGSNKEMSGVVMLGWWNIINRTYCSASVEVFLQTLKKNLDS